MKALILAGGYGTRLRPLSCNKPKLLFPILGKPILERTLNVLAEIGVDEAVLAVNYLANELKRALGKGRGGIAIKYSLERRALGTGGAVKNAEKLIGRDSPFLIMNGDVMFEKKIGEILKFHERRRPVATIALHEVEDPSRFGVVKINEDMFIEDFVEKPKPSEAPSKLINAGLYAADPRIFDYIKPGRVSMEREVFPALAKEGALLGYKYDGFWLDVGEMEDFVKANFHVLESASREPIVEEGVKVGAKARLIPPVFVGARSKVNGEVGPYAVVNERCRIERGAKISNSILFSGVRVGKFAVVKDAVLGDRAEIGEGSEVSGNSILGSGVVVKAGVKVHKDVKVCPFKEIKENVIGPKNVLC